MMAMKNRILLTASIGTNFSMFRSKFCSIKPYLIVTDAEATAASAINETG